MAYASKLVPPGRVQNTSVSRNRVECGNVCLASHVPELSLLTLLSFHCLLRPAEARQLRWCGVKMFDGSLSKRYEKIDGIIHIKDPKTRRMAGEAAPATRESVNWPIMESSIPDHRLDTKIWKFTAAQHFAYFRVTSTLHDPRTSRRCSHRSLASISGFTTILRRRGRWTSPQPTCSEEFTPFCAATSSNRALPTPSCLSERYLYHSVTWHKNKGQADDAHDTSTDTLGWIMSHAYGGRALELQKLFWRSRISLSQNVYIQKLFWNQFRNHWRGHGTHMRSL